MIIPPGVTNSPINRSQQSTPVDGSQIVDGSTNVTQVPVTQDPAWTAKQQTRVPLNEQAQTVGATAAPGSSLAVVTAVSKQLDLLERDLAGKIPSQRAALIDAITNGTPIPDSMKQTAALAVATGKFVDAQMQSLPPDAQVAVSKLLNFDQSWKKSSELLKVVDPVRSQQAPPGMPPHLGEALSKMKDISGALEADILISAAAKDGMSPQQLVDAITSRKGPIAAAIIPRLGPEAISELAKVLPQTPAGAARYMQTLDGLQTLATQNGQAQGTALMSRAEMQGLLQQHSPLEVADAVLSNQGGIRGRMTLDALNALESAMIPPNAQVADAYMQRINGLQQLQRGLPATAFDANAAQMSLNPAATGLRSNQATAFNATVGAGFMPTGNRVADLAGSIAHYPTYSDAETKLLAQITDPQQRAMQELQMQMQKQALIATTLSNLANMRHEMLKTVANNLRA